MIKRALVFALAAAFLTAATAAPTTAFAAAAKKEETKEKKEKKALTPQQQKMKDCAADWREEKKAKNVKGRKAYNEFLRGCLKKG